MASSDKTDILNLSLWEASDKPERLDFRQDNEQLETLVGGHIANSLLHLSAEEKEFARLPYVITRYTGTGDANKVNVYNYDPKAVLVMSMDFPPCAASTDGKTYVYWDFWMRRESTESSGIPNGLGGITVNTATRSITVSNKTSPRNANVLLRLNERNKYYMMISFMTPPTV